jgi:hypothetical protein
MKHYEITFVDGHVQTVGADDLPPQIITPMYAAQVGEGKVEFRTLPEHRWWYVTILRRDPDSNKLTSNGKIHVNLDSVSYIKET